MVLSIICIDQNIQIVPSWLQMAGKNWMVFGTPSALPTTEGYFSD